MFSVNAYGRGFLNSIFLPVVLLMASLILISHPSPARADDASLGRKGETVWPVNDSQVEMVSEEVTVTVSAARSRVDCRFTFKNTGTAARVLMGFPEKEPPAGREGFGDDTALHDFRTFVDGLEFPVKKEKGGAREDEKAAETAKRYPFWWTWEVPFEAGETREVRNTYWVKNHYWSNGQVLAGYILTTGSYWKGPIGKARVVFRFEDVLPGDLVQIFPETYRFEGNDLVWEWTGLEPQGDIEIIFNTRRWPEIPVKREEMDSSAGTPPAAADDTEALTWLDDRYKNAGSAEEKADIVREAGTAARWQLKGAARDAVAGWLWQVAAADDSPFIRQNCLFALYELGEKEALEKLVRDIDANGMATLSGERGFTYTPGPGWQFLKEVSEKYPQSYLARGIRAYEEVRGEPYFELDRREKYPGIWPVYFHGDEQYSPEREIPGWEKFLAEFPGHPEADDAAYRLARCYEIEGRWAEALNALQRALTLPDGDMRYHIAGRLIYILDVRMTRDQLKELSSPALDPPLRPLADYTLAVKELRRDDYRQAALALEEFLKKYSEEKIQDLSPLGYLHAQQKYDLRGEMEKQLARVRELAGLKERWEGSKDPSALYDLAAAIYHDRMTYYNHLWAGQRQWYNWLGYINDTAEGRAPAEMAAFAREMINYGHSLDYFRQVYDDPSSPPHLKEKALYSRGLCYIGLYDWGQDAWFGYNKSEVKKNIITLYQKFIGEYQASPMADGALLALGAYTGEAHYLEKIIRDYPQGGMADKARELLEEMKSPYGYSGRLYGSPVPFKVLAQGDRLDSDFHLSVPGGLPEEVRKWAAANGGHHFAGSMTGGEWSYILISAGERPTAGYGVKIINIYDDGQGTLKVRYRVDGPPPGQVSAQVITYPFVLARITASNTALEFTEEG